MISTFWNFSSLPVCNRSIWKIEKTLISVIRLNCKHWDFPKLDLFLQKFARQWKILQIFLGLQYYFISALPKPPDVKLCFEGDAGILSGLSKEKIWVDHSTTDYTQMMEFNKLVTDKGAWAVEAPITGGLEALKKGQMTVFIAGDPKVADLVIITEKFSWKCAI